MNNQEIHGAIDDYLIEAFENHVRTISINFTEKPYIYAEAFLDALKKAFNNAIELQKSHKKGNIAYISVSALLSYVLLGKNAFRIDLFDNEYLLDDKEVYADWDLDSIFEPFEADMDKVRRLLSSAYIPIKKHEWGEIRNGYLLQFYTVGQFILLALLPRISELPEYKIVKKERQVFVTYGDYMGHSEVIFTLLNEEGAEECNTM